MPEQGTSPQKQLPELVLYKADWCPFCRKVMRYIAQRWPYGEATIKMRDIDRDAGAKQDLLRVGGKDQVPCLFVDGTPMYESDDIIRYLSTL
jgi:glutaredoxin